MLWTDLFCRSHNPVTFAWDAGGNINSFDRAILLFLNQFSQRSGEFDKFVDMLFGNVLLEGGFITALLWWAWFRKRETAERDRGLVICGIVMTMLALFVTRVAALPFPFRSRPRFVEALHFRPPIGSGNYDMLNWSSFPSDHAALYFCLATILFFISRKAGVIAGLHAFFVVCLTRIYLGIHYPTDILVGALFGIGSACLALHPGIRQAITRPTLRWMDASPKTFYPFLSLCMLTIATEFGPLREVVVDVWRAAKGLTHI